jgi:hypothetical protein
VFFHILGNDDKTLKRVYQLSTEARKPNQDEKVIEPKLYVSILHSKYFERIYDEIKKHNSDIVIYSPNKDTIKQSVFYFLENKWEPRIKGFFYLVALVGIVILFINTLSLLLKNSIELSKLQIFAILLTISSFILTTLHRKRMLFPGFQRIRSIFYPITCLVKQKYCEYRKE